MGRCTIRNLMMIVAVAAVCFAVLPLIDPIYQTKCTSTPLQQCESNIHNVVLAMMSYENVHGSFPSGTVPNAAVHAAQRLGLYAPVTPYMECQDLYTSIDQMLPWDGGVNRAVASQKIGILVCPLASRVTAPAVQPTTTVGIAGLGTDAPILPKTHPRAGIFGYDHTTSTADIKDGASTTMMLAESGIVIGSWLQGGPATVRGLDPDRKPFIGPGRQFGGLHDGVAVVAMADGSVRAVSESVDPKVFEAMSTIAGGENLPADRDE
jgi:Protein of unknown function (DUF1559)